MTEPAALKQSKFTDNNIVNSEPVAIRYDFDGYGYQYIDSGSGSDWLTRVNGELLYTHPSEHDLGIAEAIGFEKGYNTNKLDESFDRTASHMAGEYRSLAEEITEGFEALKRIRELEAECDRLYRIIELNGRTE
jgi:hypothetical protein